MHTWQRWDASDTLCTTQIQLAFGHLTCFTRICLYIHIDISNTTYSSPLKDICQREWGKYKLLPRSHWQRVLQNKLLRTMWTCSGGMWQWRKEIPFESGWWRREEQQKLLVRSLSGGVASTRQLAMILMWAHSLSRQTGKLPVLRSSWYWHKHVMSWWSVWGSKRVRIWVSLDPARATASFLTVVTRPAWFPSIFPGNSKALYTTNLVYLWTSNPHHSEVDRTSSIPLRDWTQAHLEIPLAWCCLSGEVTSWYCHAKEDGGSIVCDFILLLLFDVVRDVGPSMFEGETAGLNAMYNTHTIRVPKPLKVGILAWPLIFFDQNAVLFLVVLRIVIVLKSK